MTVDQRATFAKVLIENGEEAKTIYSFRLERIHWIFGILASIAAIAVALVVLRGAVYAAVQDVAGAEFQKQLRIFHSEARPAIEELIDDRIAAAVGELRHEEEASDLAAELAHAKALSDVANALGRMEERLGAIERRLDRMEAIR